MDIMSSIKNAVAEGGLRKTNLSKNEIEKRGDDAGNQELQAVQLKPKTLLYEVDCLTYSWKSSPH